MNWIVVALSIVGMCLTMPGVRADPPAAAAFTVDLLAQPGWLYRGLRVEPKPGGLRVIQNEPANKYGWVELHRTVDTRQYPVLRVAISGAGKGALWCVKVQFPPAKEEWLIPETDQNGVFDLPIGEYIESYPHGECIFRFFVLGSKGATVTLKALDLLGGAAEGVAEQITVHDDQPRQAVDGAGGQADYPLWTIGKQYDHVSSAEIHTLIDQLHANGATVARVGAYGDVLQAASHQPSYPQLVEMMHHVKVLREAGIKTLFVTWSPAPEVAKLAPMSDAWHDAFVKSAADFLDCCAAHGAPIAYFELQNEPHANPQWWTPPFLARCARSLAEECARRKLQVEIIGPDGWDKPWVDAWASGMGEYGHIIALKAGADRRGTREVTAHHVAASIADCEAVSPMPRRFWLTEYGCWAWGNPDVDRRGANGPCDGVRYGTAMAELTHYYIAAGISCPSIWELLDVRRIDEVAGHTPPQDPKRWGMFRYKTEGWTKRAHFATLGHYDRALAPGSRVYGSESSGGLLPTAVQSSSGEWRIVIFNRFGYAKRAIVNLPAGDWGSRVRWTVTDPNAGTTDDTSRQINAHSVTVALPTYGIGTITLTRGGWQGISQGTLTLPDPSPPVIETGALLFSDDFASPTLAKWTAASSGEKPTPQFTPEHALNASSEVFLRTPQTLSGDRMFQTRLRVPAGAKYEVDLIPWIDKSANRSVLAKFRGGRVLLQSVNAGTVTGLPNSADANLSPDVWHVLTVRLTKKRLETWIDGKFLLDYEGDDLPPGEGAIGFQVKGVEIHGIAVFAIPAGRSDGTSAR